MRDADRILANGWLCWLALGLFIGLVAGLAATAKLNSTVSSAAKKADRLAIISMKDLRQ